MPAESIHALIPAAGRSVRFGGTTLKQYAHLLGKPVIARSIDAVSRHPMVTRVTVALAADDGIYGELLGADYPDVYTTEGGDNRAQSVLNGLRAIEQSDPECSWVLVHDAARPCLRASDLCRLIEAGQQEEDGAILAIPVSDTLKRSDKDERIAGTEDRRGLWRAQTPQMFPFRRLLEKLSAALSFGQPPTDEAQAMERAGARPLLVAGSSTNIKITGPDDLALAELILSHDHRGTGS